MGRYDYKKKSRSKYLLNKNTKSTQTKINLLKLRDKKINTVFEKRMLDIAKAVDVADSWQTSRVEHFKSNRGFPDSHSRPDFIDMVECQDNIWFQDITQLPTNSTDNLQECLPGKYQIKTIQSRLRFYSKNLSGQTDVAPVCIRVALVKINNSGRKSIVAGGSNINADIWPNATMIGDTNLRYSGIHKKDKPKTIPYDAKAVVIAQEKFWLGTNKSTNGGRNNGSNSSNSTASVVKEVILTKTYTNPLTHYQVIQDTIVDDILTQEQNKSKILGDRVWLVVLSDQQLDFAFYGVSGCIYNYSELEGLPSVVLPEAKEIIGGQAN